MKRDQQTGFTLIEMLIAMSILLIGMSSILGLFGFGLALQRNAEKHLDVAHAVERILLQLKNQGPAQLNAGEIPGHPDVRYSVRLLSNPEFPYEYLAEIDLQWQERGKPYQQKVRTVLRAHKSHE